LVDSERFVLGAGPFRLEQDVVGTNGGRHCARHTVRRVVPDVADRPPDGEGGRRRPHDLPVVCGRRRRCRGRRTIHEAQRQAGGRGQERPQAPEARRAARAKRYRSAGGQVGRHVRWCRR